MTQKMYQKLAIFKATPKSNSINYKNWMCY